jgi:RNA polymerase sigma-70 factor (ECF subfamily)
MTEATETEREHWLVLQAQSGSHEALNDLFKCVQEPLFRYILSLVKQQQLAEDILQEVFIRIYRKLRWLREPRAFRSWTYRIASRESFRYLRQERPWADQVSDDAVLTALPDSRTGEFSAELIESIPQMVGRLSPASRAVVVLFYLHEMSLGETAAVLDVPLGTVKSRLAYGLEALRQQLKGKANEKN